MRSLSPEEVELWGRVAATIRPLSRERISSSPKEAAPGKVVEAAQSAPRRSRQNAAPARAPGSRPELHRDKTLDGSWDNKLRSGSLARDRVVDLHGMNLDRAWTAIDRNLEEAIGRGERVLLLITGHHRPGDPPVQRGRIRAAVHDWLATSRHSGHIAAVRGAHRRHGGGGSLYLVLRRTSRPR
jgi:DNA-nicking Smr family endonuclease